MHGRGDEGEEAGADGGGCAVPPHPRGLTRPDECSIFSYMSNSKSESVLRLAGYFKALSHPHRLRVFLRLFAQCRPGSPGCSDDGVKSCVGELGSLLGISPSTVSHHLKELRQSGLIRMERRGRTVDCWIDPQVLKDLAMLFSPEACGVNPHLKRRSA